VAELAEALKISQDEKKLVESALQQSKKELENEDDLSVIENLRGKHERAMKIAEDLRTNNASLAKSLSTKDRKIQDLEKALAEQNEASKRKTSEILEKLKLLYEEYKKSRNEFDVRPAPLPDNIEIPEFMDWMETEFQALSEVISDASDFTAAFSMESILKILHDYDCADLAKFRDAISQFPSATSTSIIQTNADVQAIKNKFAREFWLTSGKEVVKVIARSKLAEVVFCSISSLVPAIDVSVSRIPFTFLFFLSQLNEEENRENIAASLEGSTSCKDSSNLGEGGSGGSSSSSSSSSSDEGSNDGQASEHEDSYPKVDVTN
jgi:hypothetical protein